MCSIVGSYSLDTVKELVDLNSYRGQHSHSIFVFDSEYNILYKHRSLGEINFDIHDLPDGYIVCHQQAPTTDSKTIDSVHPAVYNSDLLWHNGIIKANEIARLQQELDNSSSWDTELLVHYLNKKSNVDNIDGTFSCLWYHNQQLFIFRNEISPMFVDKYGNISSTKFTESESLEPNKIWKFNPPNKISTYVAIFETVENPYFFMDT